jgi:peptide-methionine (S)-S-oxide reductase
MPSGATQPTYDFVCTGFSGHTEAVQVFYDPKQVSFQDLCKVLMGRIDPTLKNQVGNDRGTQYR